MSATVTKAALVKGKRKSKMERPAKIQREIKVDKTVMDNFYNLVHSQAHIRLTAATSTFKILNVMKKTRTEIFNENLNYCIERLVAGLASNRAQARRGYGTLLLEILNSYQVATDRLLGIALSKFGHISKETSGDNLLGYFLLISLILGSGNYKKSKANIQNLEKVFRYLVQLHNTKSYFEYPVSKLLVEYSEDFHPFMLADIPQHAFGSDTKLSSIELLTILLCNKKEPVRGLINLDNAELMEKFSILLDNKFQKRPLHPVFLEATQFIASLSPSQLTTFYSKIIHPTFFRPDHNELAAMGLEFTVSSLKNIHELDAIKVLLNEHVLRTLIMSLRNQTSLKTPVNKFFDSLKDLFLAESQDEKQYAVLDRLTSAPGSIAFDEDSKSSSIKGLLLKCNTTVLKRYLDKLMSKKNKKDMTPAITRQIAFITHRPQMVEEHETMKKIVQFLLTNMNEASNEICKCSYVNAYHAVLEQIVSSCTHVQRIEHFEDIIAFYEQSSGGHQACSSELWLLYKKQLSKHQKLVKKHNDLKKLYPITSLFLFYGLQIIEHQLDCKEQLEELERSTKEVLEESEDSAWADIMTDQVIAILSATECKPWIRKLSERVFRSLIPYISSTSVDLLCEAIKAPTGDEEDEDDEDSQESSLEDEDDVEAEEEEETSENEENNLKATSNKDKESVRSDEEEEVSMMDVEGEEKEGDKVQQNSTSEQAQGNDEGESEEEEYLDDEQMMKLDSVLADMFKLNRKKKSDPSFKLRCLDLVKVFLQKSDNSDSVNTILSTVIPLHTSCRKHSETRPVSDKIMTFLTKMTGKSKYPALVDFLEKQKGGKKKGKGKGKGKMQRKTKKDEAKDEV